MIRFQATFEAFDGPRIRVPREKKYNENYWCSFNTEKQLIMCNVIYLGKDDYMQMHVWYDGIIELPYGEDFPPYGSKHIESIELMKLYHLNYADEIVGSCILHKIIEIIRGDFSIKKNPDGTI